MKGSKDMNKITCKIEGMACGMCESHINDAIRNAFQVKKVTSSHAKKETVILTEETIEESRLKDVIAKTGYELVGMETEPYEKKGFLGFHL
jgi:copper chaperone CopZ